MQRFTLAWDIEAAFLIFTIFPHIVTELKSLYFMYNNMVLGKNQIKYKFLNFSLQS